MTNRRRRYRFGAEYAKGDFSLIFRMKGRRIVLESRNTRLLTKLFIKTMKESNEQ
jgi:hypothetical protein